MASRNGQKHLDHTLQDMAKSPRARRQRSTASPTEPVVLDPVALQIAANLKRLRLSRGLSQDELARLTNSHLSHVGRAETGAYVPGGLFVRAVAMALGVSSDDVLLDPSDKAEETLGARVDRVMGELSDAEQQAIDVLISALLEQAKERAIRRQLERGRDEV